MWLVLLDGTVTVCTALVGFKALLFLPDLVWVVRAGPALRRHLPHTRDRRAAMRAIERSGGSYCRACGEPVQVPPRPLLSWLAAGASGRRWRLVSAPVLLVTGWAVTLGAVAAASHGDHPTLDGYTRWICAGSGVALTALAVGCLVTAPVLRFALGRYDLAHSDLNALRRFQGDGREAVAFSCYFLALAVMNLLAYWALYDALFVGFSAFHGNVISMPITWGYLSAVTASTVGYGDILPASAVGQVATTSQLLAGPLIVFWLFSVLVTEQRDSDASLDDAGESAPVTAAVEPPVLSVVIPSFNEGAGLARTVHKLIEDGGPSEIIVVDDGSTDDSGCVTGDPAILRVVRATRRRGKGWAVREGAKLARGRFVLVIDADAPVNLDCIAPLLKEFQDSSWDCLLGTRRPSASDEGTAARRLGARIVRRSLQDGKADDPFCPFKLIRRDSPAFAALVNSRANGYLLDLEFRSALRTAAAPVLHQPVDWRDTRGSARQLARRYGPFRVLRDAHLMRAVDDSPVPRTPDG